MSEANNIASEFTPRTKPKQKRGFAAMSPEKRAEIARKGGQRVHQMGKGYQFPAGEKASSAGSKGGRASQAKRAAAKAAVEVQGTDAAAE